MTDIIASAGVDGKKISSPGHYNLSHVELYPHSNPGFESGKPFLEIKDLVTEIEITEALDQTSIFVTLFVVDTNNILETLRICGNEKIHIHIIQDILKPSVKKEIDIEVYISDIVDFVKPTPGAQTYKIIAVSKEAFYNQLETLNYKFDDSVTELINNICKDKLKSKLNVTTLPKGGGLMKGIYPNLKPFQAIKWLARNGVTDGSPYFFWHSIRKNNKGVNKPSFYLSTYKAMILEESIETFNNVPFFKEKERTEENFYTSQLQKIREISSDLNISVFNNIRKGAYASKTVTVDLSKKTVTPEKFDYSTGKIKGANDFPPFNPKVDQETTLFEKHDSNKIYISENANAFDDKLNYHSQLQSNIKEAQSYMVNAQSIGHRLTLSGNPDLHAGAMIDLNILKAIDGDELGGDNSYDQYMSGKYMILSIVHKFSIKEYITVVDIAKDSSKLDLESGIKL